MDHQQAGSEGREYHLDEPGFQGSLRIEEREGRRHVVVNGIRTDGSEAAVQKDVPADRDEQLEELVRRCLGDDGTAPAGVLAHLGVLDPEP